MTRRTKSEQPSKNEQQTADGKFAAGNKLGKGRPQGSRNKVSLAIDELLGGEAEKLTRKAIELAMSGDTVALRLCLERLCPPRKERPISCKLPKMEDTGDLVAGISAIMAAVGNGELTPGEGQALASLIEAQRRTLESEDMEQRLIALEAGMNG
jgi:hypothetical protein